jgi:hypothetical protein
MAIRGTEQETHETAVISADFAAIPAASISSLLGGLLLLICP